MSGLMVATYLLNSLWMVTAFAAVAALLTRLLWKSPARHHHLLWLVALAVSALAPLLTLKDIRTRVTAIPATSDNAQAGQLPNVPAATENYAIVPESQPDNRYLSFSIAPWQSLILTVSYFAFLLYRFGRFLRACRKTAEILRGAHTHGVTAHIASVAERCRAALRVRQVTALCSPAVAGPLTLGTRRPVIILPEGVFEQASQELLTSALGHEMAHIRRRDYLLNIICEVLLLPIAFHPAAALMKRMINETRELACDEMVADLLLSPSLYARSLVAVAASISEPRREALSLGIHDTDILEERIMRLMNAKPRIGARNARLWLAGATLVFAISTFSAGAFAIGVSNSGEALPAPTQDKFVGTWKGTWKEHLRPRFRTDSDSGPVWLKISRSADRLSGTVMHDYISLEDQPGQEEKLLVLNKTEAVPMFDLRVSGNTLLFKEARQDTTGRHTAEWEFELTGSNEAKLVLRTQETGPWTVLLTRR